MYEPKYFSWNEFDCPGVEGSGIAYMDHDFVRLLDTIREKYGRPIKINSGWRSVERNEKVGGKPDSAHLHGLAVDIACDNSRDRHDILQCIYAVGINRIGIHKSFIHIDVQKTKSADVIWLY